LREFYRQFFPYIKEYKLYFSIAIIASLIVAGASAASAYLVKPVLDDIFIKKDVEMLKILPLFIILAYSLKGGGIFVQTYYMNFIGQDIVRRVRDRFLAHILTLELDFFNRFRSGELISRSTNDIDKIRAAVSNHLADIIREGFTVFGLIFVVIYQSPSLAFYGLIVLPLSIYPILYFAKKVKKLSHKIQEKNSDITSKLSEIFNNVEIIKTSGGEKLECQHFSRQNSDYLNLSMKAVKYKEMISPFMETLGSIAVAAVIVIGGIEVIEERMSVGAFFSFMAALFMLYTPFKRLSNVYSKLQEATAAAERIFQLLHRPSTLVEGSIHKDSLSYIELRDVSLSYGNKEALKNINLFAKRGECIALVGNSGAGKSSLINLMLRLYDTSSGEVILEGNDIRDYKFDYLRENISVVTQRIFIFNDTIASNVAYGQDIDEEKVVDALKKARAYEFVEEYEGGIYHILDEFGANLSGGQRQRIAIARAIYKNPALLILDEATSALDNSTEAAIKEMLREFTKNRITFVIAHRLSSIEIANKIVVMKNGKIVCMDRREIVESECREYQSIKLSEFAD
ncbi:MAG: ABC transporter ATP-binding protein, partial [Campylobacterales bacterium]